MEHELYSCHTSCLQSLIKSRETFPKLRRFLLCILTRDLLPHQGDHPEPFHRIIHRKYLPIFPLGFEVFSILMKKSLPTEFAWRNIPRDAGWMVYPRYAVPDLAHAVIFELVRDRGFMSLSFGKGCQTIENIGRNAGPYCSGNNCLLDPGHLCSAGLRIRFWFPSTVASGGCQASPQHWRGGRFSIGTRYLGTVQGRAGRVERLGLGADEVEWRHRWAPSPVASLHIARPQSSALRDDRVAKGAPGQTRHEGRRQRR